MSGFVCTNCGETVNIFDTGGGELLAIEQNVPFLGKIPIEPALVQSCDTGKPFVDSYRETKTAQINFIRHRTIGNLY